MSESNRQGISRRRFVGMSAGSVGAAGAGSLLPPSLHQAMAMPVTPGGLDAVEHIIVLMQENRSFDNYFGTIQGVRGFGDRNPLKLPTGGSIFRQPSQGHDAVLPFSVREAAVEAGRPDGDIQYLGSLNHDWDGSTQAWADGWNDAWIAAKSAATMTYYDRRDLPLQFELADTFTFCDAYHCSIFGSTNPNRLYLWSGKVGYEPGTRERAVTNAAYDYDHPGYTWTTYPERLEAAGVSWQIYQEWDNFTDNAVEYFAPLKRIGRQILQRVEGAYRTTEEFYVELLDKSVEDRRKLLGQFEKGRAGLDPADRRLFDRAAYRSEPGTLLARVRADIEAHSLPRVSWLVAPAVASEHPDASTPLASANLIYDLLDAIASDPDLWSRTALVINFDENDGYFDHVPPPAPPRPESRNGASRDGADWYDGRPIGLGPRVPMTVVSPWTIGGHVSSELFDHTSVLRLLERWTGVEEPNISTWRRTACGDLTSVFDFEEGGRQPRVAQPDPVGEPIDRWYPDPPGQQQLPEQEPGRRPARAVPYQPTVSAFVDSAGELRVTLANAGSRSAHFAIYPYAHEFIEPRHLDVPRHHTQRIKVRGQRYQLAVQGPNGFWYELAGSPSGPAAGIDVRLQARPPGAEREDVARLSIRNAGPHPVTLHVESRHYRDRTETLEVPTDCTRTLDWPTDEGWYDLEVKAPQDRGFRRRLTGRVEDGRPAVTA